MQANPPADDPATRHRRFDSQAQEAYLNLWRTYDRLRAAEDALFDQHDLTAQQYNALRLLRGVHPETLATLDLQGRLVSRAPDITRLLDKLESRELIRRERPSNDRRTVRVGVTSVGLQLLKKLDKPVQACHELQLGHMPPADLHLLTNLLQAARRPHEDAASPWR